MTAPLRTTRHCNVHRRPAIILVLAAICLLAMPVTAHSPTDMKVSFDPGTAKVSVTITHPVPDPGAHYIKTVRVKLNDRIISDPDYRSQPTKDSFTYTYDVNAHPGDTIRVTAVCSLAGSLEKTYDVPGTARPVTTALDGTSGPALTGVPVTTVPPTAKASAGLLSVLGVVCAVMLVRKE